MNHPEKQLKYSIRKVSVGAASVVIGALYLLMGAGIAHAEGVESARETERAANPTDPEQSGNGEAGNKPDLSNTDAAANTYNAPVAENPLVAPKAANFVGLKENYLMGTQVIHRMEMQGLHQERTSQQVKIHLYWMPIVKVRQ